MQSLRVGVVGGTGLYQVGAAEPLQVETTWGNVALDHTAWGRRHVFFLARHGRQHSTPAHRVNHAANIAALQAAHVDYVLAVNNVGSLRRELRPGRWILPHDLLDWNPSRLVTFHHRDAHHADMLEPYCPTARGALASAAGLTRQSQGVYVGVSGPRFESAAEIRAMAQFGGDVVGMTGVPEAVLAREAGLCYASLCWIGNLAAGLSRRVDATSIAASLDGRQGLVRRILRAAVAALPTKKACACQRRARRARIGPLAPGARR